MLVDTGETLISKINPREPWGAAKPVQEAIKIVQKIIAQDIERDPSGKVKLREGVAEDRLISVHDPEMRRGHKTQSEAFEGYKLHQSVDIVHGFILATAVTSANTHDSEPSAPMAERAEENSGHVVSKVIGDCAYGTEKNRAAHADAGRELVAKLPRPPQGGKLPKGQFKIDVDDNTVTCPQGVTTSSYQILRARNAEPERERLPPDRRRKLFVFPPERCGDCPQRAACVSGKHASRSIEVGPHEKLFIEARAYQRTEQYKADRQARQIAERQIARMMQLHARSARFFGIAKVAVQVTLIAAVVNLTRLAALAASAAAA